MTVALFFGHATSNVGDLALNTGLGSMLRQVGVDSLTAMLPAYAGRRVAQAETSFAPLPTRMELLPKDADRELLEEYCRHPERLFRHYEMTDADTVLIHGGEHFYSTDDLADLHPFALWRFLPLFAAKATGRRAVLLPSSFGPFRSASVDRLVEATVRMADARAAREPASARLLAGRFGLDIPVVGDVAFHLLPDEGEGSVARRGASRRVAVAMRLDGSGLRAGRTRSADREERARATGYRDSTAFGFTVSAISALVDLDPGLAVTLFVQAGGDAGVQQAILDEVATRAPATARLEIRDCEGMSPPEYQGALREHGFLLSSRFHACILALSAGVPSVGVQLATHGHKMPGLFEMLGADGDVVAIADGDARSSRARASELREGAESRLPAILDRMSALREESLAWLESALAAPPTDRRRAGRRALDGLARLSRRLL